MKQYKYIVGVHCFTYNHASYITDTLKGFIEQQTTFPYVCVVVDDASTDGEQEVIKSFVNEHFDINNVNAENRETEYAYITCAPHKSNKNCSIVVLYLKYNHYQIKKNKLPYLSEWLDNSKYHALCEGDDYWIDPLKLQKQVDFLEANPEYVLSHTNFRYYFEFDKKYFENKHCASNLEILSKGLIPEDILHRYFVQTLTAVMRRDAYQKAIQHDEFLFSGYFLMGDTQLWYELSKLGKIHFLTDVTGVYRKNEGSATRGNIKNSYRFELSSAELRQYLCERDNLSPSFCKKTQIRYNRALYNYKVFDQTFIPKFENTDEGIRMFILLNAIFLLKPVLIIMVKLRAHIGYVKRLILG